MTIRPVLVLAPVFAVLAVPLCGQTPPPSEPIAGSFTEQIEVTAVELLVDVRDKKGRMPTDLTAEDFEVLEDGQPMKILGLDPPTPRLASAAAADLLPEVTLPGPREEAVSQAPWRFLVYVDAPLTDYGSIRRCAKTLVTLVPDLVARGAVEVVVADPVPRVELAFTRDAERLVETLAGLDRAVNAVNQVGMLRRNFLQLRDASYVDLSLMPGPLEGTTVQRGRIAFERDRNIAIAQLRDAARQEYAIIQRQMGVFAEWMASYGPAPASAVILVNDGFNFEPVDFYTSVIELPETDQTKNLDIAMDFNHFRLTEEIQATTRLIAAQGWTSLILASRGSVHNDLASDVSIGQRNRARSILGGGQISDGGHKATASSFIGNPLEPLQLAAADTGGEVLTSLKKAGRALERLDERYRLTYLAERGADGKAHRLDVRLRRKELRLKAPNWVRSSSSKQIAAARVRRLLIVDEVGGEVPVEARLAVEPREAKGERKRVAVDIVFDLAPFQAALPVAEVPIRFTVGVALVRARPFLYQVTEPVPVPDWATFEADKTPKFHYTIDLEVPPEAWRIAVVVEEPESGLWGGTVARAASRAVTAVVHAAAPASP